MADHNIRLEAGGDRAYPVPFFHVGYILQSTVLIDPATVYGGTWVRIKDRFLLSAGDTYSAGATGGEATHQLTLSEMPSHNHSTYYTADNAASGSARRTPAGSNIGTELPTGTSTAGGGQAHNNMPPYRVVYCWEKTAM